MPTKRILIITILFVSAGQLALTLYIPALPMIAKDLGVSYGTLLIIPAAGYILGNALINLLNNRVSTRYQVIAGLFLIMVASISIILLGLLTIKSLALLTACLFTLTTGIGLTFSNIVALSLKPFSVVAGAAAAVSGFLQMSGTSLISAIININHIDTIFGLGASLLACTLVLFALLLKVIKQVS